jgi:hypothetical protein
MSHVWAGSKATVVEMHKRWLPLSSFLVFLSRELKQKHHSRSPFQVACQFCRHYSAMNDWIHCAMRPTQDQFFFHLQEIIYEQEQTAADPFGSPIGRKISSTNQNLDQLFSARYRGNTHLTTEVGLLKAPNDRNLKLYLSSLHWSYLPSLNNSKYLILPNTEEQRDFVKTV